ncbi:sn-glycerol-3-phosphate ABC transporter ATP-binding protein UgpC [Granulosicoccus sp.]|nr:sn-glycerol-3-phosphate ABC transporter ATP-binding protein UgpC [Granulosicoccus sp.]
MQVRVMATIQLSNITKSYGDVQAILGVNLDIDDGEFVAFVGPSGCGKSTLLRMIAGLEEITSGTLDIGERRVNTVEPRDRDVAMVFQDYALYPHMSVKENIGFGLKMRKASEDDIKKRVAHAASILQIEHLLDRKPAQLSGGQRQRVAMGRAIVRKPSVFLFDEPLSNLDAKLRIDMRTQIKRLREILQTTTVYVTHDQVEAMTLADRIVIMRDGLIEQTGRPIDLYKAPINRFVAEFIGSPQMNMLNATVATCPPGSSATLHLGDSLFTVGPLHNCTPGDAVLLGIRPEHLLVDLQPVYLAGTVELIEQMGSDTMVLCQYNGQEFNARVPADWPVATGRTIPFSVKQERLHVFSEATGKRLNVNSS